MAHQPRTGCIRLVPRNSISHCITTNYATLTCSSNNSAYKRWNCQVIQTCKLLSTYPSKPFPRRFPDPSQFAAAKLTYYSSKPQRPSDLIKAATTLGLLAIMATHPALRRCTPEPWPYYKVSMSDVYSQCHKSWGELFMKSLFWMGTFKVF